jgi:hypothetical protein
VAKQAGHSIATLARHYAGVIRELQNKPRAPAGEAIRDARDAQRTQSEMKVIRESSRLPCKSTRYGRCRARTSDLRLVRAKPAE